MRQVLAVTLQGAVRICLLLTIRIRNKMRSLLRLWKQRGIGTSPDRVSVFSPEGRSLLL